MRAGSPSQSKTPRVLPPIRRSSAQAPVEDGSLHVPEKSPTTGDSRMRKADSDVLKDLLRGMVDVEPFGAGIAAAVGDNTHQSKSRSSDRPHSGRFARKKKPALTYLGSHEDVTKRRRKDATPQKGENALVRVFMTSVAAIDIPSSHFLRTNLHDQSSGSSASLLPDVSGTLSLARIFARRIIATPTSVIENEWCASLRSNSNEHEETEHGTESPTGNETTFLSILGTSKQVDVAKAVELLGWCLTESCIPNGTSEELIVKEIQATSTLLCTLLTTLISTSTCLHPLSFLFACPGFLHLCRSFPSSLTDPDPDPARRRISLARARAAADVTARALSVADDNECLEAWHWITTNIRRGSASEPRTRALTDRLENGRERERGLVAAMCTFASTLASSSSNNTTVISRPKLMSALMDDIFPSSTSLMEHAHPNDELSRHCVVSRLAILEAATRHKANAVTTSHHSQPYSWGSLVPQPLLEWIVSTPMLVAVAASNGTDTCAPGPDVAPPSSQDDRRDSPDICTAWFRLASALLSHPSPPATFPPLLLTSICAVWSWLLPAACVDAAVCLAPCVGRYPKLATVWWKLTTSAASGAGAGNASVIDMLVNGDAGDRAFLGDGKWRYAVSMGLCKSLLSRSAASESLKPLLDTQSLDLICRLSLLEFTTPDQDQDVPHTTLARTTTSSPSSAPKLSDWVALHLYFLPHIFHVLAWPFRNDADDVHVGDGEMKRQIGDAEMATDILARVFARWRVELEEESAERAREGLRFLPIASVSLIRAVFRPTISNEPLSRLSAKIKRVLLNPFLIWSKEHMSRCASVDGAAVAVAAWRRWGERVVSELAVERGS
ncbi:hypothetical protein M427DRAFT_67897 [Gonapodya prolifera JEL478]|uniref:Uncharacterized protein n=1 Tax=Gonapodya prolifera (strain JEL478) TaxID=1344416 RepID=A0A139AP78_GONPJ|nr:hypothetical protein M427DRAFT_67897 [Gonapodya prolifera JEL478]|eukprot:KXS18532.1 hypothetical protein M427DRAFT_67897 [Gonapodya prolifera JEL478]